MQSKHTTENTEYRGMFGFAERPKEYENIVLQTTVKKEVVTNRHSHLLGRESFASCEYDDFGRYVCKQ